MKEAKLKRLELRNFQPFAEKDIDFGRVTEISGYNASGKTTIANAICWLIWNCDYQLRDNPNIRMMVEGKPVRDADVSVKAVFDFNGREITAQKVQKRKYGKDGTSFKDDNSYFINDVPKTMRDFNEYFDFPLNIWRYCSNPNAFLSEKPDTMRSFLFGMVEDITDLSVAQKNEELAGLVTLLECYTKDEITAMYKASNSKCNKELPVLDGRIKENEDKLLKRVDTDPIRKEREQLTEEVRKYEERLNELHDKSKEYDDLCDRQLWLQQSLKAIEREHSRSYEESKADARIKAQELMNEYKACEVDAVRLRGQIAQARNDLEAHREMGATLKQKFEAKKAEVFKESDKVCPYCKQELPKDKIESLVAEFNANKKKALAEIRDRAKTIGTKIKHLEKTVADTQVLLTDAEKKSADAKKIAEKAVKEYQSFPEMSPFRETEKYVEYKKEREDIENKLYQLSDINEEIDKVRILCNDAKLKLKDVDIKLAVAANDDTDKRLAELRKTKEDMEQTKMDCERILFLIKELEKKKNEAVVESVNSMFDIVQWKLFDFTKSGEYKSCCVPMVHGKSLMDCTSNTANILLGRMDICRSIQRMSQIETFVILDNAEALDKYSSKAIYEGGQTITMRVDNKDMEVKHDNN